MTNKRILKSLPLLLILILEVLSWLLNTEMIQYTVNHLMVFVLVYIGYQLLGVQENNKNLTSKLNETINLLSKREYKNSNLLSLISYGYSKFDPKDFPKIWANLMWNSKIEFLSSNYIHPKHLWNNKFSRASLLIQQAKIANENTSMSRLFIYEDEDEFSELQEPIRANFEAGLDVYTISKKQILEIPHLNNCLNCNTNEVIETLAFNLIDHNSLLLYDLNEDRKIKSFRLTVDEQEYKKYKNFYIDVLKSAIKFTG